MDNTRLLTIQFVSMKRFIAFLVAPLFLSGGCFIIAFIVLAFTSCSSSNSEKKGIAGPLAGIEEYTITYYHQYDDEENFNFDEAYNQMKEGFEKHLTAAIGQSIPTNVVSDLVVLNTPFTIEKASGNVGRSTADPYVILVAGVQTNQKALGFIGRDSEGLPVIAGICEVSEGTVSVEIDFEHQHGYEIDLASDKLLSSVCSIDLMDTDSFDNHILYCWGESYNKKGFGPVSLFKKASSVPDELPGIYDKIKLTSYLEEGPEEDFEIKQIVLSQKNETVAIVTYADDTEEIYQIDIITPEVFVPTDLHPSHGGRVLHCKSLAVLLLSAAHGEGQFDIDEANYQEIPVLNVGWAKYKGFEIKEMLPYGNREFSLEDLVDGTRANKVTIRSRY